MESSAGRGLAAVLGPAISEMCACQDSRHRRRLASRTLERWLEHADDDVLLDVARDEQRIVISGETDFGALLALARRRAPSVIVLRSRHNRTAEQQLAVMLEHLDDLTDDLTDDLATGAVAVITDERIRVRRLPLLHNE
jgi:predicted nuclease of predicted toxin-antitoxin system